jgi:hypothetical protein
VRYYEMTVHNTWINRTIGNVTKANWQNFWKFPFFNLFSWRIEKIAEEVEGSSAKMIPSYCLHTRMILQEWTFSLIFFGEMWIKQWFRYYVDGVVRWTNYTCIILCLHISEIEFFSLFLIHRWAFSRRYMILVLFPFL